MTLRLPSGFEPESPLRNRALLLLGCALGVLSACSDGGHPRAACANADCDVDAALVSPLDGGRHDGAIKVGTFVISDAGAGAELQARLQVNGGHAACGSCAVLVAQVQGGTPPYTFEWSDPGLSGPNPQVCPSAPTDYSVIVTDDSASAAGEFSQQAMQVQVSGSVDCDPDAGVLTDDLQGCITPVPITDAGADPGDGGPYNPGTTCNDAAVGFDFLTGVTGDVVVSSKLAESFTNLEVFKAGKTYTWISDRFFPLVLSVDKPVVVDIYGAKTQCEPLEKLFTLTYDLFTWHQAYCFTPKEDYALLIVAVHLNGVVAYYDPYEAASVCSGCLQ